MRKLIGWIIVMVWFMVGFLYLCKITGESWIEVLMVIIGILFIIGALILGLWLAID